MSFRGQRHRNDTHVSTTEPQARLFRKGRGQRAQLCDVGHALMDNRNGLIVDTRLTPATGTAEREAATDMIREIPGRRRLTLAADAGYNTRGFVATMRECDVTPHVAPKQQHNAIDERTTRHPGYEISQRIRKRIEEFFGWGKTVGTIAKTRFTGNERVGWELAFNALAFNLVQVSKLLETG